jgi:predicted SAM-dependent methyltransferase
MTDVSGAKFLNLGCGTKTSNADGVVNVDWGIYTRIGRSPTLRRIAPYVIGPERAERLRKTAQNIVVYDLAKGIPAADNSVEVVYHSHLLEHLDREVGEAFVREVHRVLRPGGIQRISVPDLERYVRAYLQHLNSDDGSGDHDDYIVPMLEQSVRREAHGTSLQRKSRRIVENLLLGDARKRGETHQWMYDRKNLTALLERTGFKDIRKVSFDESSIPGWDEYGLDRNEAGGEYKPESLYMEARA